MTTIDDHLVRQSGIVTRAQALAAGMTTDAIAHRLRTRRWHPLHPGVYFVDGHRLDAEVRVRAAVGWVGEGAVLSGTGAAWWHGMLPGAPPTIGVSVPRRRNPRSRRGITIRRRDVAAADRVRLRDLTVTGRALTVLEAAMELGPAGGALLDQALQRTVRFDEVYGAYCRNLGARGSAGAGRLLVAAADRSACVAERMLIRLLRDAGLRGWRSGFSAHGFLIDVAFPHARVAIEIDGWAWHMDATRSQVGKQRQHALVRRGWTVLRFTWHDLVQRPGAVVAEICRALLAAQRARSA